MNARILLATASPGRAAPAHPLLNFRHALLTTLLMAVSPADAAGGHHAVDDASLLDPGQCQLETWGTRAQDGSRSSAHLGPGCRIGPMELGLNLDRAHAAGTDTEVGPQLKWAAPLNDDLSLGILAASAQSVHSPASARSRSLILLATWQLRDGIRVHANAGRDVWPHAQGASHAGASVEWQAAPAYSFVAERWRQAGGNAWRGGARASLGEAVNVDISRASSLRHNAPSDWTVGLTWVFAR